MSRPSLLVCVAVAVASLAVLGAAAGAGAADSPPPVGAPVPPAPPSVPTPAAPTPPEVATPASPTAPQVTTPAAPAPPEVVAPVAPTPPSAFPPPGGSVAGFDTTATVDDPQWFVRMYDRGFRLYVLHATVYGTCTPWPNAEPQMAMALDAGLEVAAYTRDPRCWEGGIEALGLLASQLQFFALDVETDPGVPITHEMVAGIEALGVRPVVYSGYALWPAVMGTDVSFAGLPLWDTNVTPGSDAASWRPDVDEPPPVPFGGWNTPDNPRVLVQQVFDATYDGVVVDLDSVRASFLR